jgi:putative transcriptional regulator
VKNRLKEARLTKDWTQAFLAEKVNVSRQTIISIESDRYLPSVMLALKIAKAFGKKVEDIFSLDTSDMED